MEIISTYSVAIRTYNKIFKNTMFIYRDAVRFFLDVALKEWDLLKDIATSDASVGVMETITHATKGHPDPKYDFDTLFCKFPSYLRRAAIMKAVGTASSYMTNHDKWLASDRKTKEPSIPEIESAFPTMYKDNIYQDVDDYSARIKIYDKDEWKWLNITFRKSDVDYIKHHCVGQQRMSPTLTLRGKKWSLDFPFKQKKQLTDVDTDQQRILAVDLGINNACACAVMTSDGAVHGRHFLQLPVETDRLETAIGRIKKAQQHGERKMPKLWARAKGINNDIAVKTTQFIIDTAVLYNVDVIVFEYLDLNGRKRGSKKQKLHLWKARDVQKMVEHKAHILGMHIRRVCARNTSRLAYDGSGETERGTYTQNGVKYYNYSICVFTTGKIYNCDLNAAYNIGARYFIREIFKSCPETDGSALKAKDPSLAGRSTSTLSTLINLNAELRRQAA